MVASCHFLWNAGAFKYYAASITELQQPILSLMCLLVSM